MRWAVGVTTVPSRREVLLPRTLTSIRQAGFPSPRLFVDGARDHQPWLDLSPDVTNRHPAVRTHGNWVLALLELYVRDPKADLFLTCQDDMVMVKDLRQYLEANPLPAKAYGNLFTYPDNQAVVDDKMNGVKGWFRSNQLGKGAVCLLLPRDAVLALISSRHMAERPMDDVRGSKGVDGGIVTALAKAGIEEHCHNPSLVQHTGDVSTMGNKVHGPAPSFPGEGVSITELMR